MVILEDQILEWMSQRKAKLDHLVKILEKRTGSYPEGTLQINKCRGQAQYFHRSSPSEKKGKYLNVSQRPLAMRLAQKAYDRKVLNASLEEIGAIQKYLDLFPDTSAEKVYEQLSPERQQLVSPLEEPDDIFLKKWENVQYEGKPFPDGYPEYLTSRDERVRSKSEIVIANELANNGILYRYEFPLELAGFGTVYPDFTILNTKTREEIIWEHFGRMDDPEYADIAIRKKALYNLNGYSQRNRLIITEETNNTPLNIRLIRKLIRDYGLLPQG